MKTWANLVNNVPPNCTILPLLKMKILFRDYGPTIENMLPVTINVFGK